MNTLNFLDANVWLALIWSRHSHSKKAQEWFARSAEEKFFYCRITQVTVLRLLTTSSVMGSDTRKMGEAWEIWDKVCDDERIAFLPEPESVEREFRRLSALRTSSPKVWADSYLLAFAGVAGLKLVTFDQGMKAKGPDALVL
ncbi:MAG TPA: TA system VapC family ribonuclease toxin [Candidatus Acidoferrum sp.]|nr:TA system VapC family ribonuclease toxin [Candidatus Acidoferrum sp.]